MNTNNPNLMYKISKIVGSLLMAAILASVVPTTATGYGDGEPPEEVKKTPFKPSQNLRQLRKQLKACIAELGGLEYDLNILRKAEASKQMSVDGWKKEKRERKSYIKQLKTRVSENERLLKRGTQKNGETLSSGDIRNINKDLKFASDALEEQQQLQAIGVKIEKKDREELRQTKADTRKKRTELRNQRARCARLESRVKKASS